MSGGAIGVVIGIAIGVIAGAAGAIGAAKGVSIGAEIGGAICADAIWDGASSSPALQLRPLISSKAGAEDAGEAGGWVSPAFCGVSDKGEFSMRKVYLARGAAREVFRAARKTSGSFCAMRVLYCASMSIPIEAVRQVAHLLQESGLHEIVIESSDEKLRLKLRRDEARPAPRPPARPQAPHTKASEPTLETVAAPSLLDVTATAVGLYQEPPKPLQIGDEVARKQVVAIVESLKIPTEITSPARARVVEMPALAGQGVEYGQVLLRLEPIVEETA